VPRNMVKVSSTRGRNDTMGSRDFLGAASFAKEGAVGSYPTHCTLISGFSRAYFNQIDPPVVAMTSLLVR
jgi:hypothetical protein